MNIKTNNLLILSLTIALSSCVHIKTPEENIRDLDNRATALVISGCEFKYKTNNILLQDTEKVSFCTTYWESKNGNEVSFRGYSNINFITPGTYEFTGISGYISSQESQFYNKPKESPSILTSFTVEGGDVIYIGDIEFNTINSKYVLQSIEPVYYKMDYISKYLAKRYPTLTSRLQKRHIKMKPEMEFVRDYIPSIEE